MNTITQNKKTKSLSIMMALCLLTGTTGFADAKAPVSSWDKILLSKNKGYAIEKKMVADVTGDGKDDTVYVLSHKFDKDSVYKDHYKLAVVDNQKGSFTQTSLPKNTDGGYDATLTLADVFGSKAKEILLVSSTGGSGGIVNFVTYTYDGKGLKLLLDSDKAYKSTEISGTFKDNYKVVLNLKQLNKQFTLDVKDRKPFYEEGKIYTNGKLNKPEKPEFAVSPWGGSPDLITLKDNKQTGRKDIVWHTVAKGIANVDSLAEVFITWTADSKGMKPVDVEIKQMFTEAAEAETQVQPKVEVQPKAPATTSDLGQSITKLNAESKANSALEKAIISKLEIPKEEFSKTKYYYNYVDLNGDGIDEIFAVVVGPYTSGTGGSTALILAQIKDKLKVNQVLTLVNTPVIISDKVTKGCKEIIVRRSGGGAVPNYVVLTCSDGLYKTVNNGTIISDSDFKKVVGKAIICNDMVKDMEQNAGLYLTGK